MLLLCAGLVFMAAGIYGFFGSRRLVRKGLRADAEVVVNGFRKFFRIRRQSWTCTSAAMKKAAACITRSCGSARPTARRCRHGRVGGSPPHARPGDQVRVIYQPGNPQTVSLDTIIGRGMAPMWLFILVGLGITVYAEYRMAR